jgi:hypothetical protein
MSNPYRAMIARLTAALQQQVFLDPEIDGNHLPRLAEALLAQPEPAAPTDEQTFELADNLGIIRGHGGDLHVSLLDLTPFAESVLALYARPTTNTINQED